MEDFVTVKIFRYFPVMVTDYHQFDEVINHYAKLGLKFKYEEVGSRHLYEAVFWLGDKPTDYIKERKADYEKED